MPVINSNNYHNITNGTNTEKKVFFTPIYLASHPQLKRPITSTTHGQQHSSEIVDSAVECGEAADYFVDEESVQQSDADGGSTVAVESFSMERKNEKVTLYPVVRPLPENRRPDGSIICWADEPWDVFGFLDFFHEMNPHIPRGPYPTRAEHEAKIDQERAQIKSAMELVLCDIRRGPLPKKADTKEDLSQDPRHHPQTTTAEDEWAIALSKQLVHIPTAVEFDKRSDWTQESAPKIEASLPRYMRSTFSSRVRQSKYASPVRQFALIHK